MGIIRGMARTAVVAGTASAVSGNVHRRQQQKWANENAEAQVQSQAQAVPQAAPVAPTADDQVTQLEKLAQLKEKGVLTEEEFTAKKAQILGI